MEQATAQDWSGVHVMVTGGAGFLGRRVCARLHDRGAERVVVPRSAVHDLRRSDVCLALMREFVHAAERAAPVVIHCAGLVGGLGANTARPGEFFHDNLVLAVNVIEAARASGLIERGGRVVVVGSMTSYPARARVPFREEDLEDGYPDAASGPYGIAKRAALEMLRAYRAQYGLKGAYVVPVNLYGPGDKLDPAASHFVGALVDRCVRAKREGWSRLECWGTGAPTRDFLFVEDAAEGVVRAAEMVTEPTPINLGSGREHSIREVVEMIVRLVGYEGEVVWDASKPDGVGRRCVDVTRARELLGWRATVPLEEGLRRTIEWRKEI
ncbi:MAG: NAD-dependent epimerase/dehydratase family protein [Phycisphaerales bacterium]